MREGSYTRLHGLASYVSLHSCSSVAIAGGPLASRSMASFLVSNSDRAVERRLAHNDESVGRSVTVLEASGAYDIVVHEHPEMASIG